MMLTQQTLFQSAAADTRYEWEALTIISPTLAPLDKPACQAAEIEYVPSGWSVPYFLLNWGNASARASARNSLHLGRHRVAYRSYW
jgi:hypothetical protein